MIDRSLYALEPDTIRRIRQELTEARDTINALMATLPCPECGSPDGMLSWYLPDIGDPTAYQIWYRLHGCPDNLYTPCWQCNPHGAIDGAYTVLTAAQTAAWLKEKAQ